MKTRLLHIAALTCCVSCGPPPERCASAIPVGFKSVADQNLGLRLLAPEGWIVRRLPAAETTIAITRELRDDFPKYLVGFRASTVNVDRRQKHLSPSRMAR